MKTQTSPSIEEKISTTTNSLTNASRVCLEFDSTMTLPLQNKFALLNSLSDSSSSDEESTFVITRRRDNASEQERDTRRKAAAAAEAAKETRRVMTDAERKAASAKKSRLTFEHHTHDGNLLVVADSSLLDFNSQITTTTRTLNGGVSSSGIDAFDAVKDAERKAKNAASAKKSRQKKNQIEAMRDKQVEEMEMRNQKLDDKASKAMSDLVLEEKEDTTSENISAEQDNHVQDLLGVDVWSQSVNVWSMGVAIWEFQEAKDIRPRETRRVMAEAKSAKHFKTLNGGVAAPVVASPCSSSSSGIDAFDAVKDAERKAKNAAAAKKSRQKKNQEMRNQMLDKRITTAKMLINAMEVANENNAIIKAADETKYLVEEVFGGMRQQKAVAKLSERSIMKEDNRRLKWQTTKKGKMPFAHR
jgi:hypothetical protein